MLHSIGSIGLLRWLSGKESTCQEGRSKKVDPLEEEMATHSCILAWETPWTEDPGRPRSMVLQTVRHAWATEKQQQQQRIKSIFYNKFKRSIFYKKFWIIVMYLKLIE